MISKYIQSGILSALLSVPCVVAAVEKKVDCGHGAIKAQIGTDRAKYIDRANLEEFDAYGGKQIIMHMEKCGSGVVTAFSGKGVYYSPSCRSIGRTGANGTVMIYPFDGDSKSSVQSVRQIQIDGSEVVILFERGGNYKTRDCAFGGSREAMRNMIQD